MLKPMINSKDGVWRAYIRFNTSEEWDKWWQNYQDFLLHYARIAEETNCEMFCLGCEMASMEVAEYRWYDLIAAIRKVYSGPVTYNSNHNDVQNVRWFDAVDIIGVSGYFPVGTNDDTSLEGMLDRWKPVRKCSTA